MARIQGVPQSQAGPMVKLVYRFGPRMMKKMTGREAADRQRDRADRDLGLPAEDDERDGQVQPGGAQGQHRR